MMKIEFDDSAVRQQLRDLAARCASPAEAMQAIAKRMQAAVDENFQREGRPPWAPLAKSTRQARARIGKWPGKILHVSGALAASITAASDNTAAQLGSSLAYGAVQQYGGGNSSLPARPFLKLDDSEVDDILDILRAHLTAG